MQNSDQCCGGNDWKGFRLGSEWWLKNLEDEMGPSRVPVSIRGKKGRSPKSPAHQFGHFMTSQDHFCQLLAETQVQRKGVMCLEKEEGSQRICAAYEEFGLQASELKEMLTTYVLLAVRWVLFSAVKTHTFNLCCVSERQALLFL